MKTIRTLVMAFLAVVIGATSCLALAKSLGIRGSAHDFSAVLDFDNSSYEICIYCHAPHDHNLDKYKNGLLWNHDISSANYTMYSNTVSETITGVQDSQPTGNSKLCLGCHDGTVAIDAYQGSTGSLTMVDYKPLETITRRMDGSNIDLRGTHPVSIAFPVGGNGFNDPAVAQWVNGQTVASTLQGGKVQCSTCHDVHDSTGVTVYGTYLLREKIDSNVSGPGSSSKICLTCHKK